MGESGVDIDCLIGEFEVDVVLLFVKLSRSSRSFSLISMAEVEARAAILGRIVPALSVRV